MERARGRRARRKRTPERDGGQRGPLTLEIVDVNHDGDGVGRAPDGLVFFVPGALPEDRVVAEPVSIKRGHAVARLVSIERPSPFRLEPPCPIAGECGGCAIQPFAYDRQLAWKESRVRAALERIGGIASPAVRPILGMERPFAYRNKAQYPLGKDADGRIVLGFFRKKSHEIIPHDECLIQHPLIVAIARRAQALLEEAKLPVYDERSGRGLLRHLVIRVSVAREEAMVILVTAAREFPGVDRLIEGLVKAVPSIVGILQNVNPERTNVILGEETRLLWGRDRIVEELGEFSFEISPASFFQVNSAQAKVLYDQVAACAALTGRETVWDVYCGAGSIGLYLSPGAGTIAGVDRTPAAIGDAWRNARLNGVKQASFEVGKAEEVLPRWVREGKRADVCLLDPPRAGCDRAVLAAVAKAAPRRVVYVSCNPSTLARDARMLIDRGYALEEVRPVDMFPHTPHVEAVAAFSRMRPDECGQTSS